MVGMAFPAETDQNQQHMLRHYIVIAFRNIARHLNYSILNILGLSLGLASFIFIAMYISDELKYDKFHEKSRNIYRVNRFYNSNDVNEDAATLSFPAGPALEFDYPDMIKSVCRFFDFQVSKIFVEYRMKADKSVKFNEYNFYLADSTIFDIFTFPFVKGDPKTALDEPLTVVLTESTARRYFGDDDPIGKTLRVEEAFDLEVTGVMRDLPAQTHFTIDMVGSLSTFRWIQGGQLPQTWIWNPCWTYILLNDGIAPESLEKHLPEFYKNHYPDLSDQDVTLYLQALTDIHLRSHHDYEMHSNSNIIYVYILAAIALVVLVLACINFMNLTTAYSGTRSMEIAVKKVFGGSRGRLAGQFLGETIIQSFLALVLASVAVELLIPSFNRFTGKGIESGFILEPNTILIGLFITILTGIMAGVYPAFYLSAFRPVRVLKGRQGTGSKSARARKLLVLIQFSISIALIIGTLLVYSQLKFIRNADLGFNKEQIILLPSVNAISANFETFRENLFQHPDIKYVTGMEDILGANHNTRRVQIEGLNEDVAYWYPMFMVRHDFTETFDIKVVAGRSFSSKISSDTARAIMINETMARNMGWTNEEALGKRIRSDGNERVIGVFRDFHILSLHKPINNFILDMVQNPNRAAALTRYVAIRADTRNYKKLLSFIGKEWEKLAPNRPFEFTFLNEELNQLYDDEDKFGRFSLLLTFLALVIACLGLFGLTSYLAEQRTKEISIRRALGANLVNVLKLLSREFILLIILANLIAWPVAYFLANRWLQSFTKSIPINWFLFLLAGLTALVLALMITTYRAFRASVKNPADTLRYE
jgi:putative ABC transport system permease protein